MWKTGKNLKNIQIRKIGEIYKFVKNCVKNEKNDKKPLIKKFKLLNQKLVQ